jgi:hypothetical protein
MECLCIKKLLEAVGAAYLKNMTGAIFYAVLYLLFKFFFSVLTKLIKLLILLLDQNLIVIIKNLIIILKVISILKKHKKIFWVFLQTLLIFLTLFKPQLINKKYSQFYSSKSAFDRGLGS